MNNDHVSVASAAIIAKYLTSFPVTKKRNILLSHVTQAAGTNDNPPMSFRFGIRCRVDI